MLLRLHSPAHFGDNFTSNRQIVVTVHSTGKAQSGLEIGTSGLAVRGVAPLADGGKTVGSIEFGTKLEPVLAALKAATNADYAVLVDDRLLNGRRLPPVRKAEATFRCSTAFGLIPRPTCP